MEKSIYDLELNEELRLDATELGGNCSIRRVPGGWIYTQVFYGEGKSSPTSCFVRYDKEFAPNREATSFKVNQ